MIRRTLPYLCAQSRIFLSLLLIGSFCIPVNAESKQKKLWKASLAVLASASIADASTSWNQREANPLLRSGNGTFGGKAIAIKGLLAGGTVFYQYYIVRKKPEMERTATYVNFGAAAMFAGIAAHNLSVRSVNVR